MHNHENKQVCICPESELTLYNEYGEEHTLQKYDSVLLDSWEPHRVENTGDERAIGLDVFAPGCGFNFWTDREDGDAE